MKNKDSFRVVCAVAVTALAILILFSVFTSIQDLNKEKNEWEAFADKANAYTDYVLENGDYHKAGEVYYISWNETSCSVGGVSVTTSYRFEHSDYNYTYSVQYTSEYESLTYGYVFADDDCLRIEWHSWNKRDVVYPSDPSKDTHIVNGDKVVRVQYIPYTSISTMTVNEVIE